MSMAVTTARKRGALWCFFLVLALLAALAALGGRVVEDVENGLISSTVDTHFIQEPISAQSLPCLTPQAIEKIRVSKSIDAAFQRCRGELAGALGAEFAHLERQDYRAIFAMLVAHSMAPVGPSSTVEFDSLLKAPTLACDAYAHLTVHLAGSHMRLVGFDGGAVGDHAQLFYTRGNVHLLLDPTIALVALIDFDSLLSGRAIPARMIRHFYVRDDLQIFLALVIHALLNGKYRPTDLMYYFDGLDHFKERTKWFPTPGSAYQRRQQEKKAGKPIPGNPAGQTASNR